MRIEASLQLANIISAYTLQNNYSQVIMYGSVLSQTSFHNEVYFVIVGVQEPPTNLLVGKNGLCRRWFYWVG